MEPNDPPPSIARSPLKAGDEIAQGRYRLTGLLGRGGMGEVWRAGDRLTQHDVALKFLPPALSSVPQEVERFRLTVARIRAVRGRFLGPMYDLQEDAQAGLFIVMQFIEGETLARRLLREGRLTAGEAAPILQWTAAGLDELHAQSLVHCDVKPENVILTNDKYTPLQIIDFGISHELQTSASRITGKNAWGGGTFLYMAPEQWRGERPQRFTDQYALGCLAYSLLTGDPPFLGAPLVLRECHLSSSPPTIDGLSIEANAALARALAKDPRQRFPTCREFAEAFQRAVCPEDRATALPARPASETAAFAPTAASPLTSREAVAATVGTLTRAGDQTVDFPADFSDSATGITASSQAAPIAGAAPPRTKNGLSATLIAAAAAVVLSVAFALFFAVTTLVPEDRPALKPPPIPTQTATTSPGPTALPEIAASAESAPQFVPETAPDPTRPRQLGDDRINTLGMRLLWIPPGEFWMGSPADEAERRPEEVRRRVRLTRGFWLAKFETTQNEYEMLMGPPPSKFCAGGIHAKAVRGMNTDRFPVENVTWMEAQEFCRRLSDREKHRYRLPTEAEWEYACRAGTTTPYSFGSKCNGTEANANGNYPYGEATVGPYLARPAVVGSYPANAWGLCDMHGNVWEWCEDWYGPYAPSEQTSIDPAGVTSGDARVGRGGSWFSEPRGIRAAYRGFEHVNYRDEYLGFRLCLEE